MVWPDGEVTVTSQDPRSPADIWGSTITIAVRPSGDIFKADPDINTWLASKTLHMNGEPTKEMSMSANTTQKYSSYLQVADVRHYIFKPNDI